MIRTCKKYLVKAAERTGVLQTVVKSGVLSRWTFNRQCTEEAKQLGYRKAKRLFAQKKKFHRTLLRENDPGKRALLAARHYDRIYDDIRRTMPAGPGGKKFSFGFVPDFIENRKDLFQDRTVIDIGCGPGESTELISRYASFVYGLEYSSFILEEAKKEYRQIENIEFLAIEGIRLPFGDGSIDLAYSNDVVEHLHPDDAFMHFQEVLRVLRNDGKYYFWTPGSNSGPHDFTQNFYLKGFGVGPMASHIREYSFAEMIEILKEAGYRKVSIPDIKREVLLIAEK